ncbi:MAG: hypothetical protein QOH05_4620 [Acetobacteraceae bacterium]|nr:hypothetical protein [Acetobacteraceae bacterium]
MQRPPAPIKLPTRISFDVPDLVLLQGWSDFHDLRMAIELDVRAEDEEYEELLALYEPDCAFRRWMLWRSADGIVVQPATGQTMLFDCMADVVDSLIPARD